MTQNWEANLSGRHPAEGEIRVVDVGVDGVWVDGHLVLVFTSVSLDLISLNLFLLLKLTSL